MLKKPASPRRPILPTRCNAKPATEVSSPAAGLIHHLEMINEERKDIIRQLVVLAIEDTVGDAPVPQDRRALVDLFTSNLSLPQNMRDRIHQLAALIIDFYLRECGVGK
jgi:hypothetical protein